MLDPDRQWVIDALEKDLLETNETPEELRAEAQRVRTEAAQAEWPMSRDGLSMYAANFELVAAERQAAEAA